jgi:hypothetical protein
MMSQEREITVAQTATNGFSVAKASECLFFITPTSHPEVKARSSSLETFSAAAMPGRSTRRFAI